jgi:hypothetical protein
MIELETIFCLSIKYADTRQTKEGTRQVVDAEDFKTKTHN